MTCFSQGGSEPSSTGDVLSLAFNDGHSAQAHCMWLRHNCPSYFSSSGQVRCAQSQQYGCSPHCEDLCSLSQRIVSIMDIPPPPLSHLRFASLGADGSHLDLQFNDGHLSHVTAAWLRECAHVTPHHICPSLRALLTPHHIFEHVTFQTGSRSVTV